MPVYVDNLLDHSGTVKPGARVFRAGEKYGHHWCHLLCDPGDEAELHRVARAAGMHVAPDCPRHASPESPPRRARCSCWFQAPPKSSFPHYDLVPPRRAAAIAAGAVELDRAGQRAFFARWREHREAQKKKAPERPQGPLSVAPSRPLPAGDQSSRQLRLGL